MKLIALLLGLVLERLLADGERHGTAEHVVALQFGFRASPQAYERLAARSYGRPLKLVTDGAPRSYRLQRAADPPPPGARSILQTEVVALWRLSP